jgi:ubiquitin thioesterase protein OTUB1
LIGDLFPLALLMDEFCNNEGFYIKIANLMGTYDKYRKTRRDGSCFYRALNFSIFEQIVIKKNKKLEEHFLQKIKESKDHMLKAKFEAMVFEDILEMFIEKLTK